MSLRVFSKMHIFAENNNVEKNDWIVVKGNLEKSIWSLNFRRTGIDESKLNLTYITYDELLEGKIDMKFDYIVGNPPYQYPKVGNHRSNKKLYVDITKKCLYLLTDDGVINFITPSKILNNGQQNSCFRMLSDNLVSVNYDADKLFDIGQKVISWKYINNNKSSKISITEDDKVRYVDNIKNVSKYDDRHYVNITSKVDCNENGRKKMDIICSIHRSGVENKDIKDDGKYEVVSHSAKTPMVYTDAETEYNYPHLLLPYSGAYVESIITDKQYTGQFYTNKKKETKQTLDMMKLYIDSKLIKYCIVKSKEYSSSPVYTFYPKLPKVDFSRSWEDEELYDEFGLTNEEIREVESFYE